MQGCRTNSLVSKSLLVLKDSGSFYRSGRKYGIGNIDPILGNAANSGLQDSSIDLAFIFGLRYIAGGLSNLISEMYRILKSGGILSFEKTTGSDDKLVEEVERAGFIKTEKKGRIFVFAR